MSHATLSTRAAASVIALAGVFAGAATVPAQADSQVTAVGQVNIRSAPSTSSRVLGGLDRGQTITAVSTANGWTKVRFSLSTGYMASRYLSGTTTVAPPTTLPAGTRVATSTANLRSGPSLSYGVVKVVPNGLRVTLTGQSSNRYAKATFNGSSGWLSTRYLARVAATTPTFSGYRYTTTAVLIRSTSENTYTVVARVPKGTKLAVTGVQRLGRSQVLYGGALRWVTTLCLTTQAPSTPVSYPVEKGLTAETIAVHRAARAAFPEIVTYYGYRNDPGSDHYLGKGLDLMIPRYTTVAGQAYGQRVANWAVANQKNLRIRYVIWNQRIWNVDRAAEGWRLMADRGNDSANHKNHVHISVF